MTITLIYIIGIVIWLIFWWQQITPVAIRENKLLMVPFVLCLFFLSVNLLLSGGDTHVADIALEESLFHFLDARSGLAIKATASVLVVASIIYGVSVKRLPKLFILLESYAFIALIGLMAPITWIPTDQPDLLLVLRHAQTVPFLWGLFLAVAGIVVLLQDVNRVFSNEDENHQGE